MIRTASGKMYDHVECKTRYSNRSTLVLFSRNYLLTMLSTLFSAIVLENNVDIVHSVLIKTKTICLLC